MLAAQPDLEAGATIEELCAAYLAWAHTYYRRPDGTLTSEYRDCKLSFRELITLFGDDMAEDFSPKRLVKVREAMIEGGLCKNVVNQRVGRVRRCWATRTFQRRTCTAGVI